MRLIDADALEKDYRSQFESVYKNIRDAVNPSDFYIERQAAYDKKLMKMEMEAFCEYLQARPTIDADAYFGAVDRIKPCPKCRYQIFGSEHARHGWWIDRGDYITTAYGSLDLKVCSNCNAEVTLDGYDYYCPNCGTKMDLEEAK